MSEFSGACLWFVILILILVVGLPWAIRRSSQGYRELGDRLGFGYRNGRVTGEYRGRVFTLSFERRGRSSHDDFTVTDNTKIYMRIQTSVRNQKGNYLLLKPAGLLKKVISSMGTQAVETGHEDFYKRYTIKSQPEDFGQHLLDDTNFQQQILQAHPTLLRLDKNQILMEREGIDWKKSREYYFSLFDLLCDIAKNIESLTK